jgi:hypothetical protein
MELPVRETDDNMYTNVRKSTVQGNHQPRWGVGSILGSQERCSSRAAFVCRHLSEGRKGGRPGETVLAFSSIWELLGAAVTKLI